MSSVLIVTRHGLGDSVQLTVVLRHLQKYRPDWCIDLCVLVGKHTCYAGLCNTAYSCNTEWELNQKRDELRPHYDHVYDLPWYECGDSYADSPSTKAEYCLRHTFQIQPELDLCRQYSIAVRQEALDRASAALAKFCGNRPMRADGRFPAAIIHYQGNTNPGVKDLEHHEVKWICDQLSEDFGLVPIILDWQRPLRSPWPCTKTANGTIICNPSLDHELWGGTGTGDGEMIAAFIERSAIMIGVDSGPMHVAAATTTPTIAVWKGHHPVHYVCPAPNVVNMIAGDHAQYIRGRREDGLAFFVSHYQYRIHQSFLVDLYGLAAEMLAPGEGGANLRFQRDHWIRSDNVTQDTDIIHDVYENDCYRLKATPIAREVIVDVGACLGCFSKLANVRNPTAKIIAVECCPENIPVLKKNVGSFANIIEAACTYEPGDVALLNAVFPHCNSTGGSTVVPKCEVEKYAASGPEKDRTMVIDGRKREYWADFRQMPKVTLEDLAAQFQFDWIDILKLDCEGSEFSILRGTKMLDKIGIIVGEYHGRREFDRLVPELFSGWKLEIFREGDIGLFRLTNPCLPT